MIHEIWLKFAPIRHQRFTCWPQCTSAFQSAACQTRSVTRRIWRVINKRVSSPTPSIHTNRSHGCSLPYHRYSLTRRRPREYAWNGMRRDRTILWGIEREWRTNVKTSVMIERHATCCWAVIAKWCGFVDLLYRVYRDLRYYCSYTESLTDRLSAACMSIAYCWDLNNHSGRHSAKLMLLEIAFKTITDNNDLCIMSIA